jgi:hypothetical protein
VVDCAITSGDAFDPVIDRLTRLVGGLQDDLNRLKGINPRDEGAIMITRVALKAAKAELEKEQRGRKARGRNTYGFGKAPSHGYRPRGAFTP